MTDSEYRKLSAEVSGEGGDEFSVRVGELSKVAMFPLPDVVLLPGGLLPLHIFEPRYRDMARDVLAGSGLLAMARLRPGYGPDYFDRPAVYETVGVGRVVDFFEWPDGRYDLLVRGAVRASIEQELNDGTSYRLVHAAVLDDSEDEHPAVLRAAQEQLVSLCDRLSEVIEQGGPELHALVRSAPSPGTCADTVSAVLVNDPEERQRLLEDRDPLARLAWVIERVSGILQDIEPDSGGPMLN